MTSCSFFGFSWIGSTSSIQSRCTTVSPFFSCLRRCISFVISSINVVYSMTDGTHPCFMLYYMFILLVSPCFALILTVRWVFIFLIISRFLSIIPFFYIVNSMASSHALAFCTSSNTTYAVFPLFLICLIASLGTIWWCKGWHCLLSLHRVLLWYVHSVFFSILCHSCWQVLFLFHCCTYLLLPSLYTVFLFLPLAIADFLFSMHFSDYAAQYISCFLVCFYQDFIWLLIWS